MKKTAPVAIGLRAKTGRAIAVVLGGTNDTPRVIAKTEIKLADPKIPATLQPYHAVMELPWEESQQAVRKYVRAIESVARKNLATLIKKLSAEGLTVKAVGIVGAKDRDLSRIGNYHIRAHAAEGLLFRRVLDAAAESNGLRSRTFVEREFEQTIKTELGPQAASLKAKVGLLGRTLPPPWRGDEKLAATAAWLVLHQPSN
jgi:uncharacterized protein YqgV (UPF0045/DUF77 family)